VNEAEFNREQLFKLMRERVDLDWHVIHLTNALRDLVESIDAEADPHHWVPHKEVLNRARIALGEVPVR
jgi:hypothetical protein